ncbi:MAG: class I SAM-dependent methyltransferase [Desulfobacterales bacterium]|nr:class I SAM-dependent methyltransferase [Desulfobacterales bacterium]
MTERKFDPRHIHKLNDTKRLETLNPDYLWAFSGLKDPHVLVDVGAGTGFFAVAFAEKMNGGKIYACDTADEMIAWMQENITASYADQIIPVKSKEASIPLSDAIADLVSMINLHHELKAPEQILAEARRLLKPGAKIMIVDWKTEETPEGPPLKIRVAPGVIRGQLKKAGFVNIFESDGLPYHHILVGEKQAL